MCKFNYRYADRRRDKQSETEIVRQLTTSSSVSERQEYNLCHSWTFIWRDSSLSTPSKQLPTSFVWDSEPNIQKRNIENHIAATHSYRNNQTTATFDLAKNQCNLIYELSILGALKCVKLIVMATSKILKSKVLHYTNFCKSLLYLAPL